MGVSMRYGIGYRKVEYCSDLAIALSLMDSRACTLMPTRESLSENSLFAIRDAIAPLQDQVKSYLSSEASTAAIPVCVGPNSNSIERG
jgi:hypothetical protein